MTRVAILTSNMFKVSSKIKKGTEILTYIYLNELAKYAEQTHDLEVTVFASGDSEIPFPIKSVNTIATSDDKTLNANDKKLMELALISKALSMHEQFDIYHVHISNGEYILPFAPLVPKPIIITMHGAIPNAVGKQYYELFSKHPNLHFVSISDSQRRQMPDIQYSGTIHHGIDATKYFTFNPDGGEKLMWAGRGSPEKGLDTILEVIAATHRNSKLFPILKPDHLDWFQREVIDKRDELLREVEMEMNINLSRPELISNYQTAKLFLFPIRWEEPFGLVLIEAMACGTPVVAFARGSTPEVIVDGVTGFLINSSSDDIRGNFIIKSTGIAGLIEAVERIYAMDGDSYKKMRLQCRNHVEKHFTKERMINDYVQLYSALGKSSAENSNQ